MYVNRSFLLLLLLCCCLSPSLVGHHINSEAGNAVAATGCEEGCDSGSQTGVDTAGP